MMSSSTIEEKMAEFSSVLQSADLAFEELNSCPFCGFNTDTEYYESLQREKDWFGRLRQEMWNSFLSKMRLDADKFPSPPIAQKGTPRGIAMMTVQTDESD